MTQERETVPITDMGQAVGMIIDWHNNKTAIVQHMLTIPEGTSADIEGQEPLVLTGDVLRAYRLGVQTALAELGKLPFRAEYVEESNDPAH